MRIATTALMVGLLNVTAWAQRGPGPIISPADVPPRVDLALGFSRLEANAPPGQSGNFGLSGGFAEGAFHFNKLLAIDGKFEGSHANGISNLGQGLTLKTYMAGPRISLERHRLVPFGQALFGATHGSDSYFPTGATYTTSATSFAYELGGGLDINLSYRLAIRPVEAGFLHTSLPNGSSNEQHHLIIGAGIVLKFGGHREPPPPPPAPIIVTRPQGDIQFSCSINKATVKVGEELLILGTTKTEPDHLDVMYAWMPDGGIIEGSGRQVRLNTSGLQPGHHVLYGHAAVIGSYNLGADCKLEFEVSPAPMPPPPPPSAMVRPSDDEFHVHVPDAYFDYNSSFVRPDAEAASLTAATYLNQHPDITVRVEGFADERGTVPFNLILGQQRAVAARNALIKAGVDASRIEIISYGKAAPVCKELNESCYRQNRRAAFSMER